MRLRQAILPTLRRKRSMHHAGLVRLYPKLRQNLHVVLGGETTSRQHHGAELFVNANQQFIECTCLINDLIFSTEDVHHPAQNREHASDHTTHRLVHCGGKNRTQPNASANRDMSASRY